MKRAPLWLLAACITGCATVPSVDTGEQQVEVDSHVLLGDIALERQDFPTATREILAAAMLSDSPPYAERATRMAHELELTDVGLKAAERWHELRLPRSWPVGSYDVRLGSSERLIASYGFTELIDLGVIDILQPDIAHVGGVTALWKVSAAAEASGTLRAALGAAQIGTEIYYPVPFHRQECFAPLRPDVTAFPQSDAAADTSLALPIYGELTEAQQRVMDEMPARFMQILRSDFTWAVLKPEYVRIYRESHPAAAAASQAIVIYPTDH